MGTGRLRPLVGCGGSYGDGLDGGDKGRGRSWVLGRGSSREGKGLGSGRVWDGGVGERGGGAGGVWGVVLGGVGWSWGRGLGVGEKGGVW